VTLERIGAAARTASSTSSNRKLSCIELIRENTAAGPGPSGEGAEYGVREHSTASPQTRIQVAVAAVVDASAIRHDPQAMSDQISTSYG
jgi:hypothetical protein